MTFLLDTCVLSELVKPQPEESVLAWVASRNEHDLFLSVITLGELHKGIARLPRSRRRSDLGEWVERDLALRFHGRILDVDAAVAADWGRMLGLAETRGRPLTAIDALIAATAKAHGHSVVTRNEADFEPTGVSMINPWDPS